MAKMALKAANKEAGIVYSGEHSGQHRKDCSNTKLKELLRSSFRGNDYRFTSFADGFKKTYDWYLENK